MCSPIICRLRNSSWIKKFFMVAPPLQCWSQSLTFPGAVPKRDSCQHWRGGGGKIWEILGNPSNYFLGLPRGRGRIHIYIYIYIYLSIHLSIHPSIHESIHLSIYLSIYLPIHPSISLSTYLYVFLHTFASQSRRAAVRSRFRVPRKILLIPRQLF